MLDSGLKTLSASMLRHASSRPLVASASEPGWLARYDVLIAPAETPIRIGKYVSGNASAT